MKTDSQFEFASPEMLEDPFPFFEAVRSTDPVYAMPGRDAYLITRRDDVEFALQHPEIFSNTGRTAGKTYPGQRYETCPDLASTDPPEHKARRALYLHLLSPRRIAAVRPIMERKAHELIDAFASEPEVEIISAYAKPLPAWVMGWLLGVPDELHAQLDTWAEEYFDLFNSNLHQKGQFGETEQRLMQSFVDFTNFCGDLVVQWRENRIEGDALSDFAFSPQDDGSLFPIDQLTNEVRLMVVGAQTTANLIAQSIVETLQMDDRGDMSDERHVQAIVEESLRKDGPATYMPRICLQDVEIAGITIPAGSRVFLSLQSANRDETFFECPAKFDITRPNVKRHVAFGFGTHYCVGAPIARVEATVALTALFSRFAGIRLSPKNDYRHRTEVMALRALREVRLELDQTR